MKPGFFDRALFFLSLTGVIVISFIAGATALHYKWSSARFLSNAFEATDAWLEVFNKMRENSEEREQEADSIRFKKMTLSGKIFWDKKTASPGYTLIALQYSTTAYLVDMEGHVVHRWDMPFSKAWPKPIHIHKMVKAGITFSKVHVFPNGDLLAQYHGDGDTPYGYGIVKMDKDSNVLWTYDGNAHHDFYVDEETGNIYAIVQRLLKSPLHGLENLPYPMYVDYIVTLSPYGKELEALSLLEAFRDTPFEQMLYHAVEEANKPWDHFHTNSVRKLPKRFADKFPQFSAGQILVSLRNMASIAMIDPKTRKVVWAYRGPWKWQHDANLLNNGNILLLDNRGHVVRGREFSRVIEFNPQTLRTEWWFAGAPERTLYTSTVGRVQRLANGNTLIAESLNSRTLEITPDGDTAWSYTLHKDTGKPIILATVTRYKAEGLPFLKKPVQ